MSEAAPPDWRGYLNRRMLALLFLGFSSGLPLFILAIPGMLMLPKIAPWNEKI